MVGEGGQNVECGDVTPMLWPPLDRSGAALKSESKMYSVPIPTYFVLDRPFLIYMKKRDATAPYFVMWVDNAELLTHWQE